MIIHESDLVDVLRATTPNPGTSPPFPGEDAWTRRALGEPSVPEDRAWVALMLAHSPETWQALLESRVVARETLDQPWLRRFGMLRVA